MKFLADRSKENMLLSKEKYAKELASFRHDGSVILTADDADLPADIPNTWKEILSKKTDETISSLWGGMLDRLPSVKRFFDENLLQPGIFLQDSGELLLLYPYTSGGGEDLNFFRGLPPLEEAISPGTMPLWRELPDDLQYFYQHVHNGWTFFPANSMGPLPIGDFALLSDDKFDIDPEDERTLIVPAQQIFTVFHNGTGDYLCLDLGKSQGDGSEAGIIWWHENPGELEVVDFWAVMDTWIGIFMEEADSK